MVGRKTGPLSWSRKRPYHVAQGHLDSRTPKSGFIIEGQQTGEKGKCTPVFEILDKCTPWMSSMHMLKKSVTSRLGENKKVILKWWQIKLGEVKTASLIGLSSKTLNANCLSIIKHLSQRRTEPQTWYINEKLAILWCEDRPNTNNTRKAFLGQQIIKEHSSQEHRV